jgi:hypothetical protein
MGNVFEVLGERTINGESDYFSNRLVLERCENIHLHYRNARIELSNREFIELFCTFTEAFRTFQKYILANSLIGCVNLEDIDPFDGGHKQEGDYFDCGKEQDDHIKGIDYAKSIILEGKDILPIAVYRCEGDKFKRLDGFKRYWAYKELGKPNIMCYILQEWLPGIQHELPMWFEAGVSKIAEGPMK